MKRLVFLVFLVIVGIQTQGQVRFGVKGGMNISKFDKFAVEDMNVDLSYRFAFHAGIFTEIPAGSFFSLQPELLFSSKGSRCDLSRTANPPPTSGYDEIAYIMKILYSPCYFELPVYLKAGFKAGPGNFILGVGPYIGYGISGKLKASSKMISRPSYDPATLYIANGKMDVFKKDKLVMDVTHIVPLVPSTPHFSTVELPFDKDHLKRIDAGLTGFAGYEFNMGFFVTAGFQKGLCNIDNFDNDKNNLRNNTFTLSVGYKF